tara:strand:- start:116 stop:616 length:501 start_codon:yes stop_codon:yes gene_type:complete
MADKKVTALGNEAGQPDSTDLAHIITDVSTNATNKKVTLANVFNKIPTFLGLIGTPEVVTGSSDGTGDGVISVATSVSFISTSGTKVYSLAAGTAGQIKILVMTVAASTPVATVTPVVLNGTGLTSIQFNVVGENATLIYNTTGTAGWNVLSCGGSVNQVETSMLV